MRNQSCIRIFFVDFGHPMTVNTIEIIKTSLKNGLTLMSSYAEKCPLFVGTLVFGSECILLKTPANIRTTYKSLIAKLDKVNANEYNIKITVQEYKSLLKTKLKTIIDDLVINSTTFLGGSSCPSQNELKAKAIELTILTKKTASLLIHIVADVLHKLQETLEGSFSLDEPKIIQITNEKEERSYHQVDQKNGENFHCVLCPEDENSLSSIFKNWLFEVLKKKEQLHIILLEDTNFILKCDAYDCILHPAFLRINHKLDLCNDFMFQTSTKNSLLGLLRTFFTLEILYRIPLSGVSPNLMNGFTLRLHPTRSNNLNWNEVISNNQIFEALCKELKLVEQCLLAKCTFRPEDVDLNAFYILTSDGKTLLMNSVVPEELYLADDSKSLKMNSYQAADEEEEEEASDTVRSFLCQLELLESYSPFNFSSGLYKCLTNQLMKSTERKSLKKNLKIETDWKRKKLEKMKELKNGAQKGQLRSIDKRENNCESFKESSEMFIVQEAISQNCCSQPKRKKRERRSTKEKGNNGTHPALLFPQEVGQYRIHRTPFTLPELNFSLNDNLS